MWGPIIGAGISAGGSLLGGLLGGAGAAEANRQNLQFAREQMGFQKYALENAMRIRTLDAKLAGIHPLFAIGAPAFHPSPISLSQSAGPSTNWMGAMGQDIGRAVNALMSKEEKPPKYDSIDQLLEVQQDKQLQRDYILSQTAVNNARAQQITASIPTPGSTTGEPTSIAGIPPSQDKTIAPYVQWVDAGNELLPFPAKDLKVEDEFGAPLMAEHIIRNRVQPFLGGAAITPPPAVWKKKWPDAIGVRWAGAGYRPVYPPNDPRSRGAPVMGPVTGGGTARPYTYGGGVQGDNQGIFMP